MQLYIKPEKAGHLMYIFIDSDNDFAQQIIQGQLSTIAPEVKSFLPDSKCDNPILHSSCVHKGKTPQEELQNL